MRVVKSKIFWVAVLILLICAGLAYFLLLSNIFQVEAIEIFGNQKVNEEEILQEVEPRINKELRVGPFSLFSSRSIFLTGSQSLKKHIKNTFPRIGEVVIKRRLPNTLSLEIMERESFAEICFLSGECYKADQQGVVFEKSADVKEEAETEVQVFQVKREELMVIVVKDSTGFELGSEAVPPLYLAGASEIEKEIKKSIQMEPRELSLEGGEMVVEVDKGFKIYFDLDKNVEEQLFNLELVLREKLSDQNLEELEYIDLRFGNRIYYK